MAQASRTQHWHKQAELSIRHSLSQCCVMSCISRPPPSLLHSAALLMGFLREGPHACCIKWARHLCTRLSSCAMWASSWMVWASSWMVRAACTTSLLHDVWHQQLDGLRIYTLQQLVPDGRCIAWREHLQLLPHCCYLLCYTASTSVLA